MSKSAEQCNLPNERKGECDIGHNNFTREVYLTISTEADMPEIALEKFLESESWMKEMFHSLYGFQMKALELTERLELLYDIYHPEQNRTKFGDKVIIQDAVHIVTNQKAVLEFDLVTDFQLPHPDEEKMEDKAKENA